MFNIASKDIDTILRDYGILSKSTNFTELQRYHYEKYDPMSKQVRVIIRVDLEDGQQLVIRFKNEDDATQDIIEAQSRFAALLLENGIVTPKAYVSNGHYARRYLLNGYDVIVTVENFEYGEIKEVDAETAEQTGILLAKMHNIAEGADFHVRSEVLFDPLKENDLFSFEEFAAYKDTLSKIDHKLFISIIQEHKHLTQYLEAFREQPGFAVQGDISDCNLYRTQDGKIGIFDFNRCGDNNLYLDAVMQAIFEARLMNYPVEIAGKQEMIILSSFLKGYHKVRPFSKEQKATFPYIYALVSAFWIGDMKWNENSLADAIEAGNIGMIHEWMKEIYRRELYLLPMPI